jgi:HK97 family phage portal protein
MGIFRRERAEERMLTRENVPGVMLQTTIAGQPVTPDTALRLVDVLACVRLLAESASILPLHAYRKGNAGRQRVEGGITELLERPASGTTQANFIAQLVGSLAMRGEAFIGKFRRAGELVQLGLLPVDRMEVEIKNGEPVYTLTSDKGERTRHTTADVVHVRGLSIDGVRGLSPIAYAREALGLASALTEHASALFANNAAPLGVLTVPPGPAQGDVMENLKTGFEARHKGSENAGRVAVLAGEIKFEAVSITPSDAEFVATRKLSSTEIARLFRVPPYLIGAESGDSLTYSNVEQEGINFLRFSLAPHLRVIEQAISADADLTPPGAYWEFVTEAILRTDALTRSEVYGRALDPSTGWMRRDEVRELEDLPPENGATP